MQTASVSTGLPFALVLLISVYSLYIGFSQEIFVENAVKHAVSEAKDEQHMLEALSTAVENNTDGYPGPSSQR